ncbi:hypothetical protein ACJX0J_026588, partial [Zea mays]
WGSSLTSISATLTLHALVCSARPDMLFGKPEKSDLVALNLDFDQVKEFIKERLGIEPFVPHDQEYYLSIISERLGIEIEENWDKVKTIFLPTEKPTTSNSCAPLIATHPLEVLVALLLSSNLNASMLTHFSHWRHSLFTDQAHRKFGDFIKGVFVVFHRFGNMNPFAMVNGEPYPLDIRGELDDTTAFKNFKKWGGIEFPLPFGRVLSPTESFIHELDEKTDDKRSPGTEDCPAPWALNSDGRPGTDLGGGGKVSPIICVGQLNHQNQLGNRCKPNSLSISPFLAFVADVGKEKTLGDGDVCGVLVGGGVGGALVGVPLLANMGIAALLLVQSKRKSSKEHNKSLSLITKALCGVRRGFDHL